MVNDPAAESTEKTEPEPTERLDQNKEDDGAVSSHPAGNDILTPREDSPSSINP